MPDLRDASEEEIADALPGVDNDGDLAVPDDDSGGGGSDNDDSGGGGSNGGSSSDSGSSNESNDDNIEIGPVKDAETGEIVDKNPADNFDQRPESSPNDQGPSGETVAVQKSITVEDQQTQVPTESGGMISRAEAKRLEAEAEEAGINFENTGQLQKATEAREQEKQLEQTIDQISKTDQRNDIEDVVQTQKDIQEFEQQVRNNNNQVLNPDNLEPITDRRFQQIKENVDSELLNDKTPVQSITADPRNLDNQFGYSTANIFPGQSTDFSRGRTPSESDVTTTGFPFSQEFQTNTENFASPTAKGFAIQEQTEDFLKDLGLPDQFSDNVGRSVGSTATLGFSTTEGVKQAPQQAADFVENPEQTFEETVEGFDRANTGQLVEPGTENAADRATIIAGTDLQQQSRLGQEALGGGLALGGIAQAGSGIVSGGAVRGVNAPTTNLFRQSDPDINVERIEPEKFENRISAADAEVGPEGQIRSDQRFLQPNQGRTFGVIGEDETTGTTASGVQLFKVEDPEGQRLIAADTSAGFRQTDGEVEGISRSELVQIGEENIVNQENIQRLDDRVQDFSFETRTDENLLFESENQRFSNVESAAFGEENRFLSQANVETDKQLGTVEAFTSTKPGVDRNRFGNDISTSRSRLIREDSLERPGIRETRIFEGEDRSFGDLTEEEQRQVLQSLQETGEEIFGESSRRKNTDQGSESDIEGNFVEEVDTGSGQTLIRETEGDSSSDLTVEGEQRLGIGTDRFASRNAREAVEESVADEFSPIQRGDGAGTATSLGISTGITTSTEEITGIEQDQRQRTRQSPNEEERPFEGLDEEIVPNQDKDETLVPDTDLTPFTTTESDVDQRQRTPEEFEQTPNILTPRNPRTPRDPPSFDFDGEEENNNEDAFSLISSSQERNLRRSIGADILDIESENISETEATNPLSLRALDQS